MTFDFTLPLDMSLLLLIGYDFNPPCPVLIMMIGGSALNICIPLNICVFSVLYMLP